MRTPTWESSTGALASLLNGASRSVLYMADLYTLSNSSTALVRWTSSDKDVVITTSRYNILYKKDPLIERESVSWSTGVEVDSLSVTLTPSQSGSLIGSTPLLRYATNGGLEGCRLKIERAYASMPGSPFVGMLLMFDGRISEQSITRNSLQLTVKSDLELFDQNLPRNVYQSACMNVMYDAACGLTRIEHTTSATGASNEKRTTFSINFPTAANNFFALGTVEFTSGANRGIRRSIRSSSYNQIELMAALPAAVRVGDTIKLVRGCDRTQATCNALGNLIHFRGCPYVPRAETILSGI